MITQDPELEARLRHYGDVLRTQVGVSPSLHARLVNPQDRRLSPLPSRPLAQVAAAAAILVVGLIAAALLLHVRTDQLAKAAPTVKSVAPANGATGVALVGEFRVSFASRPRSLPSLTHTPADGRQEPARWDGSTLIVKYSGLHPARRYEVVVSSDYASALGGKGHFEKTWSFTTELGPPSAGSGPLIWYATAASTGPQPRPTTNIALGWNGTVAGTLHELGNISQSPDGLRLLADGNNLIDQTGAVVGQMSRLKGGPGWADDSRHSCYMSTANGATPTGNAEQAWLFYGPVGGPGHRVAQVGEYGGQTGPSVAACSALTDRAVVVQEAIMWAREVWLIRLSTGAVLYHHVYPDGQVASSVVASHDGRYLAEELMSTDSQSPVVYQDTQIRRTSDGTVLARIPRQAVVGFSWDGTRVVTLPAHESGGPNEVRLVEWQRNQVVWQHSLPAPDPARPARVDYLSHPGGSELAIAIGQTSTDGTPDRYEGLWIVQPDGSSRQVVAGQLAPAF